MLYFDCGITSLLCRPPFTQSRVAISSYKLLYNQFLSSRLAYYRIVECKCLNSFLYEDTKLVGSRLVIKVFFYVNFFFLFISRSIFKLNFSEMTLHVYSVFFFYLQTLEPEKAVTPYVTVTINIIVKINRSSVCCYDRFFVQYL